MAEFRIDQASPGAGTAGRSRHDLVPGEVISLVATDPAPGAGVSYTWEILDAVGAPGAALSATTGSTVTIQPSGSIVEPCAFLIRLEANDNGTLTYTERIASVRYALSGLRPALFGERSAVANKLLSNDPDLSTDNALYADLAGLGSAGQNWRGWAEYFREIADAIEDLQGTSQNLDALSYASLAVNEEIDGVDPEIVLGSFILDGSKMPATGLKFRGMGHVMWSGAPGGDGHIRLYDLGPVASIGAGTLRAQIVINSTTVEYAEAALTPVSAPGSLGEIYDTRNFYEVRAIFPGGVEGDKLKIYNAGLTLEG